MRIIARKTLREFWMRYPDCEQRLKSWYRDTSLAEWKSPADIKRDFPSASILQRNRVVFNIKGNNYRLIVRINYDYKLIWIRFVGTHSEYDEVNANEI